MGSVRDSIATLHTGGAGDLSCVCHVVRRVCVCVCVFVFPCRGAIDDATFRAKVEELGVPVTQEFDRLLTMYGPSRALSYGKYAARKRNPTHRIKHSRHLVDALGDACVCVSGRVMAALQINDVTERKTRSNATDVVGQPVRSTDGGRNGWMDG